MLANEYYACIPFVARLATWGSLQARCTCL